MILTHLLTQTTDRASWKGNLTQRFSHKVCSGHWFVPGSEFQYKSLSCGGSTLCFLDVANSRKWTEMKKYSVFGFGGVGSLFFGLVSPPKTLHQEKGRLLSLKESFQGLSFCPQHSSVIIEFLN